MQLLVDWAKGMNIPSKVQICDYTEEYHLQLTDSQNENKIKGYFSEINK